MKKIKEYAYDFKLDDELALYTEVGQKKSSYHNYCEWSSYVCRKYSGNTYNTLINFLHYLEREKNRSLEKKEILSSCTIPFITLFFSIVYTLVFSVVTVINTYNNSINTLINEEFMQYTGYSIEMIYEALEQNLYSGMKFYAVGAAFMIMSASIFIFYIFETIKNYNLKNEFYLDYITIIQEIIDIHTGNIENEKDCIVEK